MADPVVLLSTGDVIGPVGVTDSSLVLFDGTSGKKIKGNNATVTTQGLNLLDDVDATANRATIGLDQVNNTPDLSKPVSTPQATALALKANLASPTLTGIPTTPTGTTGDSSQQIANNAFVAASSIGCGQTWQNLTTTRALGTVYTNSTGKAITLSVIMNSVQTQGYTGVAITVNSIVVWNSYVTMNGSTILGGGMAIIPAGATYKVTQSANYGSLNQWNEMR